MTVMSDNWIDIINEELYDTGYFSEEQIDKLIEKIATRMNKLVEAESNEELEEMPQMKGTLEALESLTLIG